MDDYEATDLQTGQFEGLVDWTKIDLTKESFNTLKSQLEDILLKNSDSTNKQRNNTDKKDNWGNGRSVTTGKSSIGNRNPPISARRDDEDATWYLSDVDLFDLYIKDARKTPLLTSDQERTIGTIIIQGNAARKKMEDINEASQNTTTNSSFSEDLQKWVDLRRSAITHL